MVKYVKVLACSMIQYCDESFDRAKVMCMWLFQGEGSFLQNTQLQLKRLPTVFLDQGEDVLSHSKHDNFDVIPMIASDFCQPAIHPIIAVAPQV